MNQQQLFADAAPEQLPPHCRSRRTDPPTSRVAGANHEASGKAGTHRQLVADAVTRWPGRTSAELAAACGLDRYEVARRLPEVERAGRIRRGAARRCQTNGNSAVTWWPT